MMSSIYPVAVVYAMTRAIELVVLAMRTHASRDWQPLCSKCGYVMVK